MSKRKEDFNFIIISMLVCLEMKWITAGQILNPLVYLFIEQTLVVHYHTSSLCINFCLFCG